MDLATLDTIFKHKYNMSCLDYISMIIADEMTGAIQQTVTQELDGLMRPDDMNNFIDEHWSTLISKIMPLVASGYEIDPEL